LIDVWMNGQKEWLRASAHIGEVVIDVTREVLATSLGWQTCWPSAWRDPIRWYEHSVRETLDSARRVVDLVGAASTTMTGVAEGWLASAEDARHGIEEASLDVDPPVRRRQAA
jgi:hypothetical protein